jgi:hypothetical protein
MIFVINGAAMIQSFIADIAKPTCATTRMNE